MKRRTLVLIVSVLILPVGSLVMCREIMQEPIATFSIAAYDPVYREFGVAVQSKFLAVGSAVPFASSGAGAIATQAWGNTSYGRDGLELLRLGTDAETVVRILTGKDEYRDFRQLGVVDAGGNSAAFTGDKCQAWAGHKTGMYYTVQGNILAGRKVVDDMAEAFDKSAGEPLAQRLIDALKAGQAAGGDTRGRQSAAILVVRESGGYGGQDDNAIDLRVDDHPEPIDELQRILDIHTVTFGITSYLQSSTAFESRDDKAAADACLARALKLAEKTPDLHTAYLNAVAWTLVEKNRDLERALVLAERAVQAEPESPEIIDTLATILFMMGKIDQAVKWQQKAVQLKPGDTYYSDKLNEWKNTPGQ
jgi:uncharacterized Ntn-hydrolase superfamily protein